MKTYLTFLATAYVALIAPVNPTAAQFVDEDFSGGTLGALTALNFAGPPTFPGGGVVELGERAAPGIQPVVVASGIPTDVPFITVEVDMLAVPGCPGCYDHGVTLGDTRFVFHPGWPGNANQHAGGPQLNSNIGAPSAVSLVDGSPMSGNADMGFTPTDTKFIRLSATVTPNADGADNDDFDITLTELGGAGNSFTFDTYRTQNPTDWVLTDLSEFGYQRSGDDAFPTQLDRVLITAGLFTPPTSFTWAADGLGDWSQSGSWSPSGGPPGSASHTAAFAGSITGPTTAVTNGAVTVNRVVFNNTNHSFVVAGFGSVNLAVSTSETPENPSIAAQGSHEFQAIVNLHNDTLVDIASGSTLEFNNRLFLNGNVLTKTGAGELAVNNILSSDDGVLNCEEGVCSGSGTIGGDLNNVGGTISPGTSPGLAATAVPEPASFLSLFVGAIGITFLRRHRTFANPWRRDGA